ncbi:hypothetical protein FKP32DRAFT_364426 [Trametes sanguinea]|nr:hypothetical protein FKP32DRAFT_364426 [Trametes sanguinea]
MRRRSATSSTLSTHFGVPCAHRIVALWNLAETERTYEACASHRRGHSWAADSQVPEPPPDPSTSIPNARAPNWPHDSKSSPRSKLPCPRAPPSISHTVLYPWMSLHPSCCCVHLRPRSDTFERTRPHARHGPAFRRIFRAEAVRCARPDTPAALGWHLCVRTGSGIPIFSWRGVAMADKKADDLAAEQSVDTPHPRASVYGSPLAQKDERNGAKRSVCIIALVLCSRPVVASIAIQDSARPIRKMHPRTTSTHRQPSVDSDALVIVLPSSPAPVHLAFRSFVHPLIHLQSIYPSISSVQRSLIPNTGI